MLLGSVLGCELKGLSNPRATALAGGTTLLAHLSALNDERPATTPGVVTTSARQGRDADSAV